MALDSNNQLVWACTERGDVSTLANTGAMATVSSMARGGSATRTINGQIGMGSYAVQLYQPTSLANLNEYWEATGPAPSFTNDFTMMVILSPYSQSGAGTWRHWFGRSLTSSGGPAAAIGTPLDFFNQQGWGFRYEDGGTQTVQINDLSFQPFKWNLFAVVRSGNTLNFYRYYVNAAGSIVGGVSAVTATRTGAWEWGDSTGKWRLGASPTSPTYQAKAFECRLDDVARTGVELQAILQSYLTAGLAATRPAPDTARQALHMPDFTQSPAAPLPDLGSLGGTWTKHDTNNRLSSQPDPQGLGWQTIYCSDNGAFESAGFEGPSDGEPADLTLYFRLIPSTQSANGYQTFSSKYYYAAHTWSAPYTVIWPSTENINPGILEVFRTVAGVFGAFANAEIPDSTECCFTIEMDFTNGVGNLYVGTKLMATVALTGALDYGQHSNWNIGGIPSQNSGAFAGYMFDWRIFNGPIGVDGIEALLNYLLPPTVDTLSPDQGPSGVTVDLVGSNFQAGMTVTFDGLPAIVTVDDSTHALAIAPEHANGAVDVVLTNPDGGTVTLLNAYTYTAQPEPVPMGDRGYGA